MEDIVDKMRVMSWSTGAEVALAREAVEELERLRAQHVRDVMQGAVKDHKICKYFDLIANVRSCEQHVATGAITSHTKPGKHVTTRELLDEIERLQAGIREVRDDFLTSRISVRGVR